MKKISCLLACLFYYTLQSFAQILLPPQGAEFEPVQKFNPTFIANNRIGEIRAEIEVKRDGDRIRSTKKNELYRFYQDGRTKMYSHINQQRNDTAITFYEYVGQRLECEVKNDLAGIFSYCYTYDDKGRPMTRKYGRNPKQPLLTASVGETSAFKITDEKYTYAEYDNQVHSTLHNAAGRPYLKEIRYFNEFGYLVKYVKTYVMGGDRYTEDYTYNNRGWLAEKAVDDGKNPYTITYTYDEVGNLLEEDRMEQGETVYHLEYLYNPDMTLKAELKREEKNKHIVITTYTYKGQTK